MLHKTNVLSLRDCLGLNRIDRSYYANNVLVTPGVGDVVAAEDISSVKYQKVKLFDPTAASVTGIGIAANPMYTTQTSVTPGTAAANLGKAIDSAAGSTDTGVATLALRDDALSTLTPIEGDYVPLRVNSTGALWVTGNTQYTNDTTFTALTDVGNINLAVRRDANTTIASVSGKMAPLQLDAAGSLKVAITAGAGSGGTSLADGAAFTPDTTSMTPVGGIYLASAGTITDGDGAAIGIDVNRNVKVSLATLLGGEDLTNNVLGITQKAIAASTYSPSLYSEITQVTKAAIKASAGNVLAIYCSNDNAAVRYFQLHNKATAPSATEVPIYSIKVPAGTANNPGVLTLGSEFFTAAGKYFTTGIGWAISTTYGTFTDSATNTEHIAYVHYV